MCFNIKKIYDVLDVEVHVLMIQYSDSVLICKARSHWRETRVEGTFPLNAREDFKMVKLTVFYTSEVEVDVTQKDETCNYVMSTKSLMVEEVFTKTGKYEYALADAIYQLAICRGQKEGLVIRESVTVYSLMQGWSGGIYVVENRSPNKSIHVQCDCKESTNVVSTRGTLTSIDSIPPLHRQVIMILTQLESTAPFHVSRRLLHRMNMTPTGLGNWAPAGVNHEPYLTLNVESLHSPRPL
ncbi:CAPN15 [Mytilus edulis]|uniref:CAPN15 n=1 Tax=Mytilus edulis TaxID=6550 RepID=A0A8S3V042_MYTED|nr:CAPN15 [Mytilus edulis]